MLDSPGWAQAGPPNQRLQKKKDLLEKQKTKAVSEGLFLQGVALALPNSLASLFLSLSMLWVTSGAAEKIWRWAFGGGNTRLCRFFSPDQRRDAQNVKRHLDSLAPKYDHLQQDIERSSRTQWLNPVVCALGSQSCYHWQRKRSKILNSLALFPRRPRKWQNAHLG